MILRYVAPLLAVASGLLCGATGRAADCLPSVYHAERYLVFADCDAASMERLNIVVLDDSATLKVAGRMALSSEHTIEAYAIQHDRLITLNGDLVEVFDLRDVTQPARIVSLHFKHRERASGYPRIENMGPDKFLILAEVGAAELTANGNNANWALNEIPSSEELRRKMAERPNDGSSIVDSETPTTIRETDRCTYQLVWKFKHPPGLAESRLFVQQIDKASRRRLSQLFLGMRSETID